MLFGLALLIMNIFVRQSRQRNRQRTDFLHKEKSTYNNKITEMQANVEHSPEKLTRHCDWHVA